MGIRASRAALGCAVAFLAVQPVQAAMGCWNAERTAAAKVKDLQSRLMVAALRCRTMRADVLSAYNDFVTRNRATLQVENGLIHAQFETGYGKDADTYYDRFATSLANRYGGDAMSGEICDDAVATMQEAAAAAGDLGRLVAVAERFGPAPELPGGACGVAFAAASAPEAYPMQPPAPRPYAMPLPSRGSYAMPETDTVQAAPPAAGFGDAMDRALADAVDPPRAPPERPRPRTPR